MKVSNMLNTALQQAKSVAIGGHMRPDGDCVGSCTALFQYIKNRCPETLVDLYLEDIPDCFHMLESTRVILHEAKVGQEYDLFIALDCADAERLGFSKELFERARHTLCIDHHISNPHYADENHVVPHASSTAEVLYHLMDKDFIDTDIAESLYLGIVHDTGVFQYSSTAPETMEAAAFLMRKDIRANELIDKTFYEKTYAQNKILGKALLDSFLELEGKCIVSCLSKATMNEFGVRAKDLEGIVSQLRVTKGVEVAVFLYELSENEYKVSLRASGDVNVSEVATCFGGGGHVKAAGVTMQGTQEKIIEDLIQKIREQL